MRWSVAVVCVQVLGARNTWNKLYFVPLMRFFKDCESVAPVIVEVERDCTVENFGKGLTAISKLGLGHRFRDLQAAFEGATQSSLTFPFLIQLLQASLDLCGKVKEMPSLWAQTLLREKGVAALASLEASARASVPSSADIYVRGSEVLTKYNKQWMESADSEVELVVASAKMLTLGFTQVQGLCSFELCEFFPSAPSVMKVLSQRLNSLCQAVVKQLSDKMDEMRQVPLSKWQPVLDAAKGADCNFEQVHTDLWADVKTVQSSMEKFAAGQLHGRKPRLLYVYFNSNF